MVGGYHKDNKIKEAAPLLHGLHSFPSIKFVIFFPPSCIILLPSPGLFINYSHASSIQTMKSEDKQPPCYHGFNERSLMDSPIPMDKVLFYETAIRKVIQTANDHTHNPIAFSSYLHDIIHKVNGKYNIYFLLLFFILFLISILFYSILFYVFSPSILSSDSFLLNKK